MWFFAGNEVLTFNFDFSGIQLPTFKYNYFPGNHVPTFKYGFLPTSKHYFLQWSTHLQTWIFPGSGVLTFKSFFFHDSQVPTFKFGFLLAIMYPLSNLGWELSTHFQMWIFLGNQVCTLQNVIHSGQSSVDFQMWFYDGNELPISKYETKVAIIYHFGIWAFLGIQLPT